MELTEKFLTELQRRLKIGNRRGVHLNAIPGNSRYKFDINRLSHIDENLPKSFIKALLTQQPLKFKVSWKDNVPNMNEVFEEDQSQLLKITRSFENLINQTDAIESEKGINTFGFGFPILVRRDQVDNKLTVAPILIWSLRIRRTKDFNTWEIIRNEDDPIYLNEVLINHLQNDVKVEIDQISSDMMDDGLIDKSELANICYDLLHKIYSKPVNGLKEFIYDNLESIKSIPDKVTLEKTTTDSSFHPIHYGGLFSIFEVQKQNIISDYDNLMSLKGSVIELGEFENHGFQPLSSVETDPSQQGVLRSLKSDRNILIQGPPGTGKSQTLTAVLVNALENKKKTIVVCEKRTALEVLHKALIDKGLKYHTVLIRDIVKDRKVVVDSVRDRVDTSSYKHYRYKSSKETLDNILDKSAQLINSINTKHKKIDKKLLGGKTWTDVVGTLLAELKGNEIEELKLSKDHFDFSSQELNTKLNLLESGELFFKAYNPHEKLSFINPNKLIGDNPFIIEQNLKEDFKKYKEQYDVLLNDKETYLNEYRKLRKLRLENLLSIIENRFSSLALVEKNFENLIIELRTEYIEFRTKEISDQWSSIMMIISKILTVYQQNNQKKDFQDTKKLQSTGYKILSWFSKEKQGIITAHNKVQILFEELERAINSSKDIDEDFHSDADFASNIKQVEKLNDIFKALNLKGSTGKEFEQLNLTSFLKESASSFIERFHKENKGSVIHDRIDGKLSEFFKLSVDLLKETYLNLYDFNKELIDKIVILDSILNAVDADNSILFIRIESVISISDEVSRVRDKFSQMIEVEISNINLLSIEGELETESLKTIKGHLNNLITTINNDGWLKNQLGTNLKHFNNATERLEKLIQIKTEYFDGDNDIFTPEFNWFRFYNALEVKDKLLVDELRDKTDWKKILMAYYLNLVLLNFADTDLPTNENEHILLKSTLEGIEREQLKYIKEFWYSKQIDKTREFEIKNINLSVENLYNKRSSTRYKRLSLRQIVQYDPELFTTFFPIILTTPDVCSNLFKGMNGYFDIVMFDEASQLRLEDNLPAILKGQQVIIAGDEHQMPPSNYFSKIFDGAVEDEEDLDEEETQILNKGDILLSCESLLDFGSELNFEKKHLDFHYRSRHPFLIDFSNYAFYNQRLQPLPNNFEYTPIKYIAVNGSFIEHQNEAEAATVLSILKNNINRLPDGKYPSVGIATFNIAQRDLILSKILEQQNSSADAEFATKIQELFDDGMFIKNLENIQGDERDVIILSTTYGKGKDGKFAQRYGPINHSKGYKLLNVIVTRAKFKVYVCSSIPEEVFMKYNEFLELEGANNKRAVFYAYLAYSKAISEGRDDLRISVLTALSGNTTQLIKNELREETESPFEEEVYQDLVNIFGDDRLILQHQFAGFRIDLVFDHKINGVPKIAIECDGAKYHSSQEAYLYDKHRQKVLESHGFVFHRIWSTNWWKNPKREMTKLVDFIESVKSENLTTKDYSDIALAFTDDVR
ncbi:AAA domain-containing protein [Fluviicola taffensis]|uniref:AAA domain-containing protein n=1 Tax=Fluviicola taffensis TaxID=191579 RepID=UPI003137B929